MASPRFNLSNDLTVFLSRPDINAPSFQIHSETPSEVSPGYFFLSPKRHKQLQNGPYIFDGKGELVWSGSSISTGSSYGIHVCDYLGSPHLCFWEGEQTKTWGRGRSVVLDSSYRVVTTVSGGNTALDFHEFRIIRDGTVALATVYKPSPRDLSSVNHNLSSQLGWVNNCGFKEIDIATGHVLFEWFALDHIDLSETLVSPGTEGEGQIMYDAQAWDYFHINSVEKTREGDYIISGRHTSTIYKVSGRNGSVIWRLGGLHSDFTLSFPMGFQHDVRLLEETDRRTVFSMFNNQWDGRSDPSANTSSGMLVSLDHTKRQASVIQEYRSTADILCESQGSLRKIPGSENLMMSWGSLPWITEYLSNGTLVLNASVARGVSPVYRATKAPWVGKPIDTPVVWSYAKNTNSQTVLFVSWNGATEVYAWRFYDAENSTQEASWNVLGQENRTGFETIYTHSAFSEYVFAEALALDGTSLRNSSVTHTFVPGPGLAEHCNEFGCPSEVTKRKFVQQQSGARNDNAQAVHAITMNYLGNSRPSTSALIEWTFAAIGLFCLIIKLLRILKMATQAFQKQM